MRTVARATSLLPVTAQETFITTALIAAPRFLSSSSRVITRKQRHQIVRMSTESTQSQACCNTPAVVSKGYSPKGDYIESDGLKTCTEVPLVVEYSF
jgi:hypothetical protein